MDVGRQQDALRAQANFAAAGLSRDEAAQLAALRQRGQLTIKQQNELQKLEARLDQLTCGGWVQMATTAESGGAVVPVVQAVAISVSDNV